MIDRATPQEILVGYKADFIATTWPLEKCKWQAAHR